MLYPAKTSSEPCPEVCINTLLNLGNKDALIVTDRSLSRESLSPAQAPKVQIGQQNSDPQLAAHRARSHLQSSPLKPARPYAFCRS